MIKPTISGRTRNFYRRSKDLGDQWCNSGFAKMFVVVCGLHTRLNLQAAGSPTSLQDDQSSRPPPEIFSRVCRRGKRTQSS